LRIEHDVARLEIAMEDAFLMRGGETGAEFAGNFESLRVRQAADAAEKDAEILAIDILHGEKELAVEFAEVVDAANIWVGDLTGDFHFIAEAVEGLGIVGGVDGKKLEGNGLAEDEIVGAVDLAHTALAEFGDDAVAFGEKGSREEAAVAR
jgi:hypothetical protein